MTLNSPDTCGSSGYMHELTAIFAIAQRDMLKFLRDIPRMISTFIAPILFIAALGGSMEAAFGRVTPFNLLEYTFTGVFAMTLFQTTAFGLISLIEDRENDFTQEIFVSPISRYSIVIGKIVGETLVAFPQALVILVLAGILGIGLTPQSVVALIGSGLIACLLGGAFGLIVLANLSSQRAAGQIFPFIMLPQYFLAGVFNPIQNLPPYLDVASRIAPLRYCVDLVRAAYYAGRPDYTSVVPDSPAVTLAVIAAMSAVFLGLGTIVFVRRERNR